MKEVIKNILAEQQDEFNLHTDSYSVYTSYSTSFREPTLLDTIYMVEIFKQKDWDKLKSGDLIIHWHRSIVFKGWGFWALKSHHVNSKFFFICPKNSLPCICGWVAGSSITDVSGRLSKKDRITSLGSIEFTHYKNMEFIEDRNFSYRLNSGFEYLGLMTRIYV